MLLSYIFIQFFQSGRMDKIEAKISCTVQRVVAAKQAHFFVLVQLKPSDSSQKSTKFRTETSILTNRPNLQRNYFTFHIDEQPHTFKFGLMIAKSQLDSDATSAMVYGISSLPLTLSRLKQLPEHSYSSQMVFSDRGKEVGRFTIKIKSLQFTKNPIGKPPVKYNPFMSRILYQDECTDMLQLQTNIKSLQQQLLLLHKDLQNQKREEQYFQKIYFDLEEDQKQLKTQIDYLETMNSKIDHRLSDRESLENLKIEVEMLGQSQEGKKVLIERLEYFQDRIYRQIEENEKLVKQYERTRPELEANLKKAEEHAHKLKGRQLQQFQLGNNRQILAGYQNLLYEFKCNQQTIKSLSKMSQKSELTAEQARLLLSQVSYEVKLAEYKPIADRSHERLLQKIEKQVNKEEKDDKLGEEQEMVMKIKLGAIRQEIDIVRQKIKDLVPSYR